LFKSYYWEDLEIGGKWNTPTRTITESDIVLFNHVTGLVHRAFVDEEYMKTTVFGKRFASGVMVIPLAAGLFTQLRLIDETLIAMVGMEIKLTKPLLVGDTIYIEVEVTSKAETSKPDRGIIHFKYTPVNQKGEALGEITEILLIKRK
jgi:acyl dehydratase